MNGILPRALSKRSIGMATDGRRIALCVMRRTPLGPRMVTCDVHECGEESPQAVLERLLQPWAKAVKGKKTALGPWIQVGIPDTQAFQAVVPITQANRNGTAQSYFLEAVQATNVRAEDRIIDLLRVEVEKHSLACVSASPSGVIHDLLEMLSGLGMRVGLVQPVPVALFRAGTFHARAPRGSRVLVRFFLGTNQAIGVLGAGDQPLFWHAFPLTKGQEAAMLLASYSTLWMLRRNARITQPIDTIIVHGRPELPLGQDENEFRQRTGARLIRAAEPAYGMVAAAKGLALTDPLSDEPRIDLARGLKPSPQIRDVFPWAEVAINAALVGSVSLFLAGSASESEARLRSVDAELAAFPWVKGLDQAKLDGEKKVLEERIKAIASFRGSRVSWSEPLRTIGAAAPQNTVIKSLTGDAEVESGPRSGPGKSKKQLVVSFETPMAGDGSLPREIDGFLASLRGEASIKRHFPLVEVSGLRANPVREGVPPSASYSVVCLPRAEKTRPPAER